MLHAQLIIWTAATEQEVKVIFQSSKGKLCNIDLMYLNCRNDSSNENWLLQQKCLHLAHHLQRHRSVSFLAPLSESGTVHLFSWIRLCWMSRGFPMLLFQPAVTMQFQCAQRHSSHFPLPMSLWWLLQIFPSVSSLLCSRSKVYFLLQNWLSLWWSLSSIPTDVQYNLVPPHILY